MIAGYADADEACVVEDYKRDGQALMFLVRLKADPAGNTHPDCLPFTSLIQEIADADAELILEEANARRAVEEAAQAETDAAATAEAKAGRAAKLEAEAEAARKAKEARTKL